LSVSSVS